VIHHSIVPATPELVEWVFDNLASSARGEMEGMDKAFLIRRIFEKSVAWVGLAESEPACVFGIREGSMTEPAEFWLVGTPLIERYSIRFLRESRAVVEWGLKEYGVVGGFVQVGNTRSQRWLKWLGFEFKEEAEHSLLGRVYPFERRLF
jgi:hypothetical protein